MSDQMTDEVRQAAHTTVAALQEALGPSMIELTLNDTSLTYWRGHMSSWRITVASPLGGNIKLTYYDRDELPYFVDYVADDGDLMVELVRLAKVAEPDIAVAVVKQVWDMHNKAKLPDEDEGRFRQTACKHCELDIEGELDTNGEVVGYWRDRGGNWTCAKSIDGGLHEPVA